ncbi:MAG: hypothetical protein MZW92_77500 [Comamonadaceae bacterium]|nr:hypothetical protein [Comamonadaceae bacterium]
MTDARRRPGSRRRRSPCWAGDWRFPTTARRWRRVAAVATLALFLAASPRAAADRCRRAALARARPDRDWSWPAAAAGAGRMRRSAVAALAGAAAAHCSHSAC